LAYAFLISPRWTLMADDRDPVHALPRETNFVRSVGLLRLRAPRCADLRNPRDRDLCGLFGTLVHLHRYLPLCDASI